MDTASPWAILSIPPINIIGCLSDRYHPRFVDGTKADPDGFTAVGVRSIPTSKVPPAESAITVNKNKSFLSKGSSTLMGQGVAALSIIYIKEPLRACVCPVTVWQHPWR